MTRREGFGAERQEIQSQLEGVYWRWKSQYDPKGVNLDDFSAPLLLAVTDEYCRAKIKVIVYGQETYGWGSLRDFLANDDAVEALCREYADFEFAKHSPAHRSPFWQGFREIKKWPSTGVMWSNLVRCDYKGSQIFNADPKQRVEFLIQQNRLLVEEINVLQPSACLFFTGPRYDPIIKAAFANVVFRRTEMAPVRELARLGSADLPLRSYRTYHPRYLSLSRKWNYIAAICGAIHRNEIEPAQEQSA